MIAIPIVLAVFLLLAAVYLVLISPRSASRRAGMEKLQVNYAHRGLWGGEVPENSLEAFVRAADAGYGIELDVQLSSDGEVVVFHDYTLTRMCGEDIKLCELTGAQLSWRRLGGTTQTIPTLREVLTVVKGRVPLLIELKGESGNTELCSAVERELGYYDGKYCIESFNPFLLGYFKKNAPRVARGVLYTDFRVNGTKSKFNNFLLVSMITNVISRPDFLAADEKFLSALPVKIMTKIFKLPLFVWTARSPESESAARARGAHCIFEGFEADK